LGGEKQPSMVNEKLIFYGMSKRGVYRP